MISGYVNEASVLDIALSIINKQLAGPLTPLNEDYSFLVPLANREISGEEKGKKLQKTQDVP